LKVQIKLAGYSEEDLVDDCSAEEGERERSVLCLGGRGMLRGCKIKLSPASIQDKKDAYGGSVKGIPQESQGFQTPHEPVEIAISHDVDVREVEPSYENGIIELHWPLHK